jgi:hypothetical protein
MTAVRTGLPARHAVMAAGMSEQRLLQAYHHIFGAPVCQPFPRVISSNNC